MTVRKLNEADLLQSAQCAVQAFGGYITEDDLKPGNQEIIGCFLDDGTLISQLEISPMSCFFDGNELKCAAIGGVATVPQYRRMGGVRELFDYVYENYDYDISILYPFSTGYYAKFGYGNACDCIDIKADTDDICVPVCRDVVPATKDMANEVIEVYNRAAKQYNLMFRRDDEKQFFLNPFYTADYTYLWKDSEGIYRGYVSFTIVRDEERYIKVKEIIFETPEALRGLMGYLKLYEGALYDVRIEKLPVDTPVLNCFFRRNKAVCNLKPMGSVRIYNVENVLKNKKWPCEKGSFILKINDTIPCNNGTFAVEYENGTCEITKTDKNPDIICENDAMSKILLCGISEQALPYENVIINNLNPDFLRAFPVKNTFFVDGF